MFSRLFVWWAIGEKILLHNWNNCLLPVMDIWLHFERTFFSLFFYLAISTTDFCCKSCNFFWQWQLENKKRGENTFHMSDKSKRMRSTFVTISFFFPILLSPKRNLKNLNAFLNKTFDDCPLWINKYEMPFRVVRHQIQSICYWSNTKLKTVKNVFNWRWNNE